MRKEGPCKKIKNKKMFLIENKWIKRGTIK